MTSMSAVGLLLWASTLTAQTPAALRAQVAIQDGPVVQAVLFFAPTCPHCHEVIQGSLPGIFESYGGAPRVLVDTTNANAEPFAYLLTNGSLEILLIDASQPQGYDLYQNATAAFRIPGTRIGVPRLIVGDSVLVGADEIPAFFPGLIERALGGQGLAWPAVPGLETALATVPGPPALPRRHSLSDPRR